MLTMTVKSKKEDTHIEFYDRDVYVGKCHLTNNIGGDGIGEYLFMHYIESKVKGVGYGRRMLKTIKELGVKSIDGDAFEEEEQGFWKHIGAEFIDKTCFKLCLENI